MENFKKLQADIVVVMETWLKDNQVHELADELLNGDGLGLLTKNRQALQNCVSYGGVAVVWRESRGTFKEIRIRKPDRYEVLAATGSIRGHSRKFVVVACYLPPCYTVSRGRGALDHLENVIIGVKSRYNDPYLIIVGDFNQWKIGRVMDNFADLREVKVGNTRGGKAIDKFFTNVSWSVEAAGM